MTNVIDLNEHKEEQAVEATFIELLDKETQIDSHCIPLSTSLLDRMFALKAAGDKAKANTQLLEG